MNRVLIALGVILILGIASKYLENKLYGHLIDSFNQQYNQALSVIDDQNKELIEQKKQATKLGQVTDQLIQDHKELEDRYAQAKQDYDRIANQPDVEAWANTTVPESVADWLRDTSTASDSKNPDDCTAAPATNSSAPTGHPPVAGRPNH